MSGLASAVLEVPAAGHGHLIGYGDWRLAVEAWLPTAASATWDVDLWDTALWTAYRWLNITPDVRGVTINRGADQAYGVPRVGTATVTLDTRSGDYSPWNPTPPDTDTARFAPGITIRVVLHDGSTMVPLFCGETDDWPETHVAGTVDRFVTLQLVDPFARFAAIESVGAVRPGSDEDGIRDRLDRIIAVAGYPHGARYDALGTGVASNTPIVLEATTLEGNLLGHLQAAAESTLTEIFAGADGRAVVTARYCGEAGTGAPFPVDVVLARDDVDDGGYTGALVLAYDRDEFDTTNNPEHVINHVIVNGAEHEHRGSIVRFGRRSITKTLVSSAGDDYAAVVLDARARSTVRVESLRLNFTTRLEAGIALAGHELGAIAAVFPPHINPADTDPPHIDGWISGVTHELAPRNPAGVDWRTTLTVDTRNVINLPGAQL